MHAKVVIILPFIAWTLVCNLLFSIIVQDFFEDNLKVYYKSNLTGGLMSLFGLDCTRLPLLLTLHLYLNVHILYFLDIECPTSCFFFCGWYGFRWACIFLYVTASF